MKDHFTVPNLVFADHLPAKARLLLVWLYSQSLSGGQCSPGRDAMQFAIGASKATVQRAVSLLKKRGWLYNFQRQGRNYMRFWIRIPKHLVPSAISMPPQIIPFKSQES